MAVVGLIGGLALSLLGTFTQVGAAKKAEEAQQKAIAAQQRAENTRERAMEIDAQRKRRELVRQGIISKAQAQSGATAQGAQFGSALPGAYGQIAGQTAFNVAGVNTQEGLGHELFQSNRDVLSARRDEAKAGSQAAFGQGLSSLGGALGGSMGTLGRLFG